MATAVSLQYNLLLFLYLFLYLSLLSTHIIANGLALTLSNSLPPTLDSAPSRRWQQAESQAPLKICPPPQLAAGVQRVAASSKSEEGD